MKNNNQEEASPFGVEAEKIDELIKYAITRARRTCNRIDGSQVSTDKLFAHVARLIPLNNEAKQDTAD